MASLLCGVRAVARDATRALRDAGPSNFPATVTRQLDEIRREIPAGETILLVSASATDGAWYTRLFQRALYPRNEVVVRYLPFSSGDADQLRSKWSIRFGIELAPEPSSLAFAEHRDLGPLPAMPDRVFLGVLAP
jgi:hypothetical protein